MRELPVAEALPDRPRRARLWGGRRSPAATAVLLLAAVLVFVTALSGSGNVASADPSADDWLRLRQCESGNNYTINTGNGYYGAYQFDAATWRSLGGTGTANQASPATQDALALKLWQQRGWSPWVCATVLGLGGSSSPPTVPPIGSVDVVQVSGGSAKIAGWAVDLNSAETSIPVHIYVNSVGYAFTANKSRTDVNSALGVTGQHGFEESVPLQSGSNNICVFAIGLSVNNNTLIRCQAVQGAEKPLGNVDGMWVSGWDVTVHGWAFDPNSSATSNQVHVYVGADGKAVTADGPRGDVNSAFGITGRHGFSVTSRLSRGPNEVCAYSIGTTPNNNTQIQCRKIQGPVSPIGFVDGMAVSGSQAIVTGWAVDQNSPGVSIPVHVYVNNVGYAFTADKSRSDVNSVIGVTGQHGFSEAIPLRAGSNSICVFAIGLADSNNTLLECRDVQYNGTSAALQRMAAPEQAAEAPETTDASTGAAPQDAASASDTRPSATADQTAESTAGSMSVSPTPTLSAPSKSPSSSPTVPGRVLSTVLGATPSPPPAALTWPPPSTVVTTPTDKPASSGALDSLLVTGQSGTLSGWISDPTAGPTGTWVRITVDGVTHDVFADKARDDVPRVDGTPVPFGFTDLLTLTKGDHEICIYELDRDYLDRDRLDRDRLDGDHEISTAPVACRTETIR